MWNHFQKMKAYLSKKYLNLLLFYNISYSFLNYLNNKTIQIYTRMIMKGKGTLHNNGIGAFCIIVAAGVLDGWIDLVWVGASPHVLV